MGEQDTPHQPPPLGAMPLRQPPLSGGGTPYGFPNSEIAAQPHPTAVPEQSSGQSLPAPPFVVANTGERYGQMVHYAPLSAHRPYSTICYIFTWISTALFALGAALLGGVAGLVSSANQQPDSGNIGLFITVVLTWLALACLIGAVLGTVWALLLRAGRKKADRGRSKLLFVLAIVGIVTAGLQLLGQLLGVVSMLSSSQTVDPTLMFSALAPLVAAGFFAFCYIKIMLATR